METKLTKELPLQSLIGLYASVGWLNYTKDPEQLQRAIRNSTFVVSAWNKKDLVGLARVVSDEVSIMYLQDILVAPAYQRRGIGRSLLKECLTKFQAVRQKVLLTDSSPEQIAFYESFGFHRLKSTGGSDLNAFVRIEDAR